MAKINRNDTCTLKVSGPTLSRPNSAIVQERIYKIQRERKTRADATAQANNSGKKDAIHVVERSLGRLPGGTTRRWSGPFSPPKHSQRMLLSELHRKKTIANAGISDRNKKRSLLCLCLVLFCENNRCSCCKEIPITTLLLRVCNALRLGASKNPCPANIPSTTSFFRDLTHAQWPPISLAISLSLMFYIPFFDVLQSCPWQHHCQASSLELENSPSAIRIASPEPPSLHFQEAPLSF